MNITIVGGGFAGVRAALQLAKKKDNKITLITDKKDMQYFPALYNAATGHTQLEAWIPLGRIFGSKENVDVRIDRISTLDVVKKEIVAESGNTYTYETLILALGSITTYYGVEGMDTYSYGIKTHAEIDRLKCHIHNDVRGERGNEYVVIGGGATGCELAGALETYIHRLCRKYHVEQTAHVTLVQGGKQLLPTMADKAGELIKERLEKLGVTVLLGNHVEKATEDSIVVGGKPIKSTTVIWTSGVATNPFYSQYPAIFEMSNNGKIVVDEHFKVKNDIYVIGDNAAVPYAGLAQTALEHADYVAKYILGKTNKPFVAKEPIAVVPAGSDWAVVQWGKRAFGGRLGMLLRRFADLKGYWDVLPFRNALSIWIAGAAIEDDYYQLSPEGALCDSGYIRELPPIYREAHKK
ncbi:MAG: FAD-dependent oxidoreductase [Eggerthellaceae bacterium]|nr:FAD-dependent oxidoreductase [Eggerthellaceae bacterium]